MKVTKFWKLAQEDMDKGIAKFGKLLEEMNKAPEKYPKYVVPPHGIGGVFKGMSVLDADDEQQLINYVLALTPEFKIKFMPLVESPKAIETYIKTKK